VRLMLDTAEAPLRRPGTVSRGWHALRKLHLVGAAIEDWARNVGPHDVLIAAPRSFCAGVERAIDIVERALDRFGPPVYVRKQIVHNVHVVRDLERRGAIFVGHPEAGPPRALGGSSAHGGPPRGRPQARPRRLTGL